MSLHVFRRLRPDSAGGLEAGEHGLALYPLLHAGNPAYLLKGAPQIIMRLLAPMLVRGHGHPLRERRSR